MDSNHKLIINEVLAWPGAEYGYRYWDEVVVYNLCLLWPEDMANFLGKINSAMNYPSIAYFQVQKCEDYKTFPDDGRIMALMMGKGFTRVRRKGEFIIAEKE